MSDGNIILFGSKGPVPSEFDPVAVLQGALPHVPLLIGGVPKTLPDALGALEGAWTGYTPSLSAESGAVVPVGGGGAYKVVGKTVSFRVGMTISDKGDASGALYLGLPLPAKDLTALSGLEQAKYMTLAAYVQPNQSAVILKTYANSFPLTGASGPWILIVSGTYETI